MISNRIYSIYIIDYAYCVISMGGALCAVLLLMVRLIQKAWSNNFRKQLGLNSNIDGLAEPERPVIFPIKMTIKQVREIKYEKCNNNNNNNN